MALDQRLAEVGIGPFPTAASVVREVSPAYGDTEQSVREGTSTLLRSQVAAMIHEHDITTGWPDAAPKKADLVLLDPPYWKQAAGRYSADAADLGNMTLDAFLAAWASVVKTCSDHLAADGRLAFIASPTDDTDDHGVHRVVDLSLLMYDTCRQAGLRVVQRMIVPYSTQQASAPMVEWARKEKQLLKLYRDLVVMTR